MRRWFPRRWNEAERVPRADPGSATGSALRVVDESAELRAQRLVAERPPLRASTEIAPTAEHLVAWLQAWPDAPTDPAEFRRWVNEPAPEGPHWLSKFVFAVWRSRADLRETFPGVPFHQDAQERFLLWANLRLAEEANAPDDLIPAAPVGVANLDEPVVNLADRPALTRGVVVIGMLRSILGLGEAGRRVVRLCERAGEVTRSVSFDYSEAPLGVPWTHPSPTAEEALDITVIAANGTEAPSLSLVAGAAAACEVTPRVCAGGE